MTITSNTNKTTYKILVVDDCKPILEVIQENLRNASYIVFTESEVEKAIEFLAENKVDLLITDLRMPNLSGLELIKHVRENFSDMEVILITGYPSIQSAISAVKEGAEVYLVKPFSTDELLSSVNLVLEKLERRRRAHNIEIPAGSYGIIGESDAMKKVFKLIRKASETDLNLLISGESGTGKELIARAIHNNSRRRSAPFVPVNCTAIPENLIESELFGYAKGAFTGAGETREGFFQLAEGGSIFLDEIGDASLALQCRLLRVLQSKEVVMVGSNRVQNVDIRILAATHQNLPNLVSKGLFREDLYYRLNVLEIKVQPLRERGEDIFLLLNFFLARLKKGSNLSSINFSDEALQTLKRYNWPGNVRELENFIQRLAFLYDGEEIKSSSLPVHMKSMISGGTGLNKTLAEVEDEYIKKILDSVSGSKTHAARILGIDRKTLREKLKRILK
ncbi:MAG: sigma-54-dependent Fis family transcriptional regulator [Candidatus Riflebacteria bacterium]|nr:sigma-54-dependent Fis family transcriptional regulator [Candidatus Riflebacteria bacterium]